MSDIDAARRRLHTTTWNLTKDDHDSFLQHSQELLERMQASDRRRAEERLKNRTTLTDYDLKLLGLSRAEAQKRQALKIPASTIQRVKARRVVTKALRPDGIVFRNRYLESLNEHAIELAAKHRITVEQRCDGTAGAILEHRKGCVPCVTNEATYATFLHEVGHVVSPEADARQFSYRLEENSNGSKSLISPAAEVGAWRFAVANARPRWTRGMQDEMFRCMKSYAADATDDERFDIVVCISQSAFRVVDRPWTIAELNKKCDEIRPVAKKDLSR